MRDDHGVWEAARAVRPYLDELLGPRAATLDRRLAEQLTRETQPSERARRLRAILEEHHLTSRFLADVLADPPHYRPPYVRERDSRRGVGDARPSGDAGPVLADRYLCPDSSHDYVWYRPDVASPIPACPTHGRTLIRC